MLNFKTSAADSWITHRPPEQYDGDLLGDVLIPVHPMKRLGDEIELLDLDYANWRTVGTGEPWTHTDQWQPRVTEVILQPALQSPVLDAHARHILQITAGGTGLYALASDRTTWRYCASQEKWFQLPPLPQPSTPND